MILHLSTRFDTSLTLGWADVLRPAMGRFAHRYRYLIAFLVVAFSVADLLLTQTILTMVEHSTGVEAAEANALMAPIVMTWWAWPIRVGIPAMIALRDLRRKNYALMGTGALLYGLVVAWNTHMYYIVKGAA